MTTHATCRELRREEERSAARALVRRRYVAQGYDVSSDSIARYLDKENAITYGLFLDQVLYGTISFIEDGAGGLPMDAIYAEELAPWRAEGRKLAEVVQFAVDHDAYAAAFGKKPSPFQAIPLFKAVFNHAISKNIDYLCISINPKHDTFYQTLGFAQIGTLKHYDSVGAPAIARALHIPEWRRHGVIARFLGAE